MFHPPSKKRYRPIGEDLLDASWPLWFNLLKGAFNLDPPFWFGKVLHSLKLQLIPTWDPYALCPLPLAGGERRRVKMLKDIGVDLQNKKDFILNPVDLFLQSLQIIHGLLIQTISCFEIIKPLLQGNDSIVHHSFIRIIDDFLFWDARGISFLP